jgi:hypothetical protein
LLDKLGHWFEPSTAHLNPRSRAETRMGGSGASELSLPSVWALPGAPVEFRPGTACKTCRCDATGPFQFSQLDVSKTTQGQTQSLQLRSDRRPILDSPLIATTTRFDICVTC